MKKILNNKTFIGIITIIIMTILLIGFVLLIDRFQKTWCEDHNGRFILGFGTENKCIYEK